MKRHIEHLSQGPILLSSISGTTAMTAFSYLLSDHEHKNFREPDLLDKLFHRILPFKNKRHTQIAGWLLHYLVGLLFAEGYAAFWTGDPGNNIKTGMVLGGISGIAAILIWKFTYAMHPDPPSIDFTAFAAQLFVAHLLFGLFTAVGYNISQLRKRAIANT